MKSAVASQKRERSTTGDQLRRIRRDEAVCAHLPQVQVIARKIHRRVPPSVSLDDLIQEGTLGLMDAADKYDASKQVKFETYAQFRIHGAIVDSLRELDWGPRELRKQARRLAETESRLQTQLGRRASDAELADTLGLSLHGLQTLLQKVRGLELLSLQSLLEEQGYVHRNESELGTAQGDPFDACVAAERRRLIGEAMAGLTPREQHVVVLCFQQELSLKEAGRVLGVGESRISQIRTAALAKLRARLQQLNPPAVLAELAATSRGHAIH